MEQIVTVIYKWRAGKDGSIRASFCDSGTVQFYKQ
jgi:hypothetical protein